MKRLGHVSPPFLLHPIPSFMKILPSNSEGCWINIFVVFLAFFFHLVLHLFVISVLRCHFFGMLFCISLSFFSHLVLHIFVFVFLIFLSFSRPARVARPGADLENQKIVILPAPESFVDHLFVIILPFSCRSVIQAQLPGSGADLESPKTCFCQHRSHFFVMFFAFFFAWFSHFFAFLRFGVILFAFILHFPNQHDNKMQNQMTKMIAQNRNYKHMQKQMTNKWETNAKKNCKINIFDFPMFAGSRFS